MTITEYYNIISKRYQATFGYENIFDYFILRTIKANKRVFKRSVDPSSLRNSGSKKAFTYNQDFECNFKPTGAPFLF